MAKNRIVSDRLSTFFTNNNIIVRDSIPTEGTFNTGDIVVNTSETAEKEPMWICVKGGSPGEWKPVGSGNGSIAVVENHKTMMKTESEVGNLYYVYSDETSENEPGFYIVLTVKDNGNGEMIPDVVDRINKKENNIPSLTYDPSMPEGTKFYLKEDEDLILRFKFSSNTYGDGKYRVYRNGVLLKSFTAAKGNVMLNLGPLVNEGTFEITVTATDYLTVPAPETLTFTAIVGGMKLTSTFDETLLTAIYEEGDIIGFPYSVRVSDVNAIPKLRIVLKNENEDVVDEVITLNGTSVTSLWKSPAIETRGVYTLEAQAYTGETIDDESEGVFKTDKLSYTFRVLRKNEIGIIAQLKSNEIDNNTYLSIPFKVISKIANYFIVRGELLKFNELGEWYTVAETPAAGITTAVNILNYWSVGKLEIGTYKFILKAYTVDNGVESIDPAEETIEVIQSTYNRIMPIKANLLAWFDANDKRNTDAEPNVWYNNSYATGGDYRILLEGLNYNSNGWKHTDPSVEDSADGEMMLKMNGESYGYLVKADYDGSLKAYNPFSIFENSGQKGITIETAIRTRCIGEMNAKVFTCMEEETLDTPGAAITYDTMYLGSDSQINKLSFIEDEWVHVAFVIDNDIRNLIDIGQTNIENLNQTKTMRIYVNGVLCSCNTYKNDKFLDAAGNSFPFILNATYNNLSAAFENFGECEIKFIRLYNSYLTSTEVLNNYIAHIYEQQEQIEINERNNVDIAVLPTVTFRRKTDSNNKTTFGILNAITDKGESKKTCVDCAMEFNDGAGQIIVYDNVDVYLQGTSSLQYPVKNYKIKAYDDVERTSKNKFVPPSKEGDWVPDYTYTLKCDYMEQSHMNNTPIACFYDKVIDYIGGNSPARNDGYRDSIDGFPCIVYYNDGDENVLVGSFMFNIDKSGNELGFECDIYDEEGEKIGSGKDTCVSYEGTANASDTAGCFFTLDESIENVYKYYIDDSYVEYLNEHGLTSDVFTMGHFKAGIEDGSIDYLTFEEFKLDYNEVDYVMADFEARYSFNEDDDEATYRPMVNLVNWVSRSVKDGTFKNEFEEHFDLKYMLAYYLQMQLFAQVDNCGKNCMWDTWDGVKFYPRPYDMDTSMGLSNTGTETIRVDAEILPIISPFKIEGTHAGYSNNDTTTDLRYLSFNTKTSKLWNAFATEFKQEIANMYIALRNAKLYSFDTIMNHMKSMTYDVIGEIYYNKDAGSKYLSQTTDKNSEYLKMLHGNRQQVYKKFLQERITFLDTVYGYSESDEQPDTLNSTITLRSDALYGQPATETLKCYLGISVYSPQYVTISVGSGQDAIVTAYVGPESTYVDPDTGYTHEGTLFSFPIRGTDKEIIITGAGNIKQLNKLEQLNVRDLTITKAEKILELDLSYSSRMTGLTLGNNKYLRKLDCSNSYSLGTSTTGQSLDLSKCANLKDLNIAYTKIISITFPQDTQLNNINVAYSTIKNIEIDGAEFLNDINIEGCEYINRFKLNRCNKLTTVDVTNSSIKEFIVTNCENVVEVILDGCKSITNFDMTNSYNVITLRATNNSSPFMEDLHLYSLYNLEYLAVNQSSRANIIRLPKYLNAEEANKAMNGEEAKLWDKLLGLDISESSVRKIQYGSADAEEDVLDMSQLTNLEWFSIWANTSCTEIKNIYYKSEENCNLEGLFYACHSLEKISGYLYAEDSVSSIFEECIVLSDISELELDFVDVYDATYAFCATARSTTPMVKKLLTACGESLVDASWICYTYTFTDISPYLGTSNDTTTRIPSDLFEFNPNIKKLDGAFECTKYVSVDEGLLDPMANSLQTATYIFGRMGKLDYVGPGIFANKPKLTDVSRAFVYDYDLRLIEDFHTMFEGSSAITNTNDMFYECENLEIGDLGEVMYPLVNLKTCNYMFYWCCGITSVPNGCLSKNTKLTNITGLFQWCENIQTLPRSIFRVNITDTNSFPELIAVNSLFSFCENMTGVVDSTFFAGVENVLDATADPYGKRPWSTSDHDAGGVFEYTSITGYHETFLHNLPKLNDVDRMFCDCTELEYCYYYDESGVLQTRGNSVSPVLFSGNPNMVYTQEFFCCCGKLVGCIPETLFDSCKSTIKKVDWMFESCVKLTGINLDSPDNRLVGISSNWFKDAVNLESISGFLYDCSEYQGNIPVDFIADCTKISNVSFLFYNCKKITGNIPVELFNSCREKLVYVNQAFRKCHGLGGELPRGVYNITEGIVNYELVTKDTENALQVVNEISDPYKQVLYADVIGKAPGLATIINPNGNYYVTTVIGEIKEVVQLGFLANCTNLLTAEYLFNECKNITGSIPDDLFYTDSALVQFKKLSDVSGLFGNCEKLDEAYIEPDTGIAYLCSPALFEKCPAITDVCNSFERLYTMPACRIHPRMTEKQNKVTCADYMFKDIWNLTGEIPAQLFKNSINTLERAIEMFSFTDVTSVTAAFLNNGTANRKLKYIKGIFYDCTSLAGTSPSFWDGDVFGAIEDSQQGFWGALYGTLVSNKDEATAINSEWTDPQDIWA